MYKIAKDMFGKAIQAVIRLTDNAFIPLDPANTDYQKFKADVLAGASGGTASELQDAEGNVMTPEEAMAYINTLP